MLENRWIPATLKARGFPSIKQALFLTVPCDEIFIGGAARGGKSTALLAGGLQYVDHPKYSALLLRRTFADLAKPGALLDMAHEWLQNTGAHWRDRERQWKFPSGSTLNFGYLENENDKYQYQSAEYQYIAPDETTHYSETQYTYLFSRLSRSAGCEIPLRMRTSSNPGGTGHEWVKKRFITEATPFSVRYLADDSGIVRTRMFIPARFEDNPGIDQHAYRRELAALDPVTRAQLEKGDWEITPAGNMFRRAWFEIIDAVPADVGARTRGWDLAATEAAGDWLVGTKMSRTRSGLYCVEHVVRAQFNPADVERCVISTTKADGRGVRVRGEQEPGASGKIVAANWVKLLAGYDVDFFPSSGQKVTRWRPFSAQCAAGNVKLVRGAWDIEGWLDRMERVPQTGVHDDEPDSASCAFNDLAVSFIRGSGDFGWS